MRIPPMRFPWAVWRMPRRDEMRDTLQRLRKVQAGDGMLEYSLVFRRQGRGVASVRASARPWTVVRPALASTQAPPAAEAQPGSAGDFAQVFIVPICPALNLDGIAYEQFLVESGVMEAALKLLGTHALSRPSAAVTARKEIQALVMAAEVQHIIDRMSA
jgi:hypothetical protein